MALVIGLGNPGRRYERTRHNLGFRVLDELVRRWRGAAADSTAAYRSWRVVVGGREAHLLAPLTYMNRSGEALAAWRERHSLEAAALLVVSDDVYLPLGAIRLRGGGSSGGHRGLESVAETVGSEAFARLRVGAGAAPGTEGLSDHVLAEFAPEEQEAARDAERLAADAVECWLVEGLAAAMNRFNRRVGGKEVGES